MDRTRTRLRQVRGMLTLFRLSVLFIPTPSLLTPHIEQILRRESQSHRQPHLVPPTNGARLHPPVPSLPQKQVTSGSVACCPSGISKPCFPLFFSALYNNLYLHATMERTATPQRSLVLRLKQYVLILDTPQLRNPTFKPFVGRIVSLRCCGGDPFIMLMLCCCLVLKGFITKVLEPPGSGYFVTFFDGAVVQLPPAALRPVDTSSIDALRRSSKLPLSEILPSSSSTSHSPSPSPARSTNPPAQGVTTTMKPAAAPSPSFRPSSLLTGPPMATVSAGMSSSSVARQPQGFLNVAASFPMGHGHHPGHMTVSQPVPHRPQPQASTIPHMHHSHPSIHHSRPQPHHGGPQASHMPPQVHVSTSQVHHHGPPQPQPHRMLPQHPQAQRPPHPQIPTSSGVSMSFPNFQPMGGILR